MVKKLDKKIEEVMISVLNESEGRIKAKRLKEIIVDEKGFKRSTYYTCLQRQKGELKRDLTKAPSKKILTEKFGYIYLVEEPMSAPEEFQFFINILKNKNNNKVKKTKAIEGIWCLHKSKKLLLGKSHLKLLLSHLDESVDQRILAKIIGVIIDIVKRDDVKKENEFVNIVHQKREFLVKKVTGKESISEVRNQCLLLICLIMPIEDKFIKKILKTVSQEEYTSISDNVKMLAREYVKWKPVKAKKLLFEMMDRKDEIIRNKIKEIYDSIHW